MIAKGVQIVGVEDKQHVSVTVSGESPLLLDNRPKTLLEDLLRKKQGLPALKREPLSEEQLFEQAQYRDEDGKLYFPAGAFRTAAVSAARNDPQMAMVQVGQSIVITAERAYFVGRTPDVVIHRSVVPTGGKNSGVVAKVRALVKLPWSLQFPLLFLPGTDMTTLDVALSQIEKAGTIIGLGSWRVQAGGPFGRFTITGVTMYSAGESNGEES